MSLLGEASSGRAPRPEAAVYVLVDWWNQRSNSLRVGQHPVDAVLQARTAIEERVGSPVINIKLFAGNPFEYYSNFSARDSAAEATLKREQMYLQALKDNFIEVDSNFHFKTNPVGGRPMQVGVDVAIGVEMVDLAYRGATDIVLVSADGDFHYAVGKVSAMPGKSVWVAAYEDTTSRELKALLLGGRRFINLAPTSSSALSVGAVRPTSLRAIAAASAAHGDPEFQELSRSVSPGLSPTSEGSHTPHPAPAEEDFHVGPASRATPLPEEHSWQPASVARGVPVGAPLQAVRESRGAAPLASGSTGALPPLLPSGAVLRNRVTPVPQRGQRPGLRNPGTLCRFYPNCARGQSCFYAHGPAEHRPLF